MPRSCTRRARTSPFLVDHHHRPLAQRHGLVEGGAGRVVRLVGRVGRPDGPRAGRVRRDPVAAIEGQVGHPVLGVRQQRRLALLDRLTPPVCDEILWPLGANGDELHIRALARKGGRPDDIPHRVVERDRRRGELLLVQILPRLTPAAARDVLGQLAELTQRDCAHLHLLDRAARRLLRAREVGKILVGWLRHSAETRGIEPCLPFVARDLAVAVHVKVAQDGLHHLLAQAAAHQSFLELIHREGATLIFIDRVEDGERILPLERRQHLRLLVEQLALRLQLLQRAAQWRCLVVFPAALRAPPGVRAARCPPCG